MSNEEELASNAPAEVKHSRQIQTTYYRGKKLVRTTLAKWANNAVINCANHMQFNDYGATVAEVFDHRTGQVHAVITHSVTGVIEIHIEREVKRNEEEYME